MSRPRHSSAPHAARPANPAPAASFISRPAKRHIIPFPTCPCKVRMIACGRGRSNPPHPRRAPSTSQLSAFGFCFIRHRLHDRGGSLSVNLPATGCVGLRSQPLPPPFPRFRPPYTPPRLANRSSTTGSPRSRRPAARRLLRRRHERLLPPFDSLPHQQNSSRNYPRYTHTAPLSPGKESSSASPEPRPTLGFLRVVGTPSAISIARWRDLRVAWRFSLGRAVSAD